MGRGPSPTQMKTALGGEEKPSHAAQFGYDRQGLEGYPKNVGLVSLAGGAMPIGDGFGPPDSRWADALREVGSRGIDGLSEAIA